MNPRIKQKHFIINGDIKDFLRNNRFDENLSDFQNFWNKYQSQKNIKSGSLFLSYFGKIGWKRAGNYIHNFNHLCWNIRYNHI